ncbi:MAG: 4-alpha-glucanotransferase, partial [Vallitaleaceae bacterium]|nr:4-alpha-glucanotransferase [Vallitaleaceae bacterium]
MSNESTKKVMRKSGILLHPTSFPNKYGIGDLGPSSYIFIDFLEKSGQKLWQVLPLGPTGYGDSPYQAFSSFAGQPLIISPEKLIEEGLLFEDDFANMPEWDPLKIDFGPTINYKFSILRKAFTRFQALEYGSLKAAFEKFCEKEASWLLDYALFMAIKDAHGGVIWTSWDQEIAFPTQAVKQKWLDQLKDHVMFYEFIQFLFYSQWNALKDYAHTKGIQVVGDIPIFVA